MELKMKTKDYFSDDVQILDIRRDNVFKAVFTRETPESQGALSRLVSALIGYEVSIVTIVANEPPIENLYDRQIRFDISCRTENGERVNVEMSLNPDPLELVRLEYYAGRLFTSQDIKGIKKSYKDLKFSYQIAILANERFFNDDLFFHTFEYCDFNNRVRFNGRSRIITIELSKLDKIVEKPTEEMSYPELWATFFQYLTDESKRSIIYEIMEKEEGIAMASEVLYKVSQDEIEEAYQLSRLKYELDNQSRMTYAWEEGLEEGMQQGMQQGKLEACEAIAAKLKSMGLSEEQIAQATGIH